MPALCLSPAVEELLKPCLDPYTQLTSPITELTLNLHPALYLHAVAWACPKCTSRQRARTEQQRLSLLITLICQELSTSGLQQGHLLTLTTTAPPAPQAHAHQGPGRAPTPLTLEAFLLLAGTRTGITATLNLGHAPEHPAPSKKFAHPSGLAHATGRTPQ